MSDIQRYRIDKETSIPVWNQRKGEWIKHKDHLKAIEELKGKLKMQYGVCDQLHEDVAELKAENHDLGAENAAMHSVIDDKTYAVHELRAEVERGGWISVDDRLPKKHDYYLVAHMYEKGGRVNVDKVIYSEAHGGWVHLYGSKYNEIVTHWQPLPQPPTSEDL